MSARGNALNTLALAVILAVLLCACGSKTGFGANSSKIGFIFVGQQDDLGYNQAAYEGSVAVARAFPDNEVLRSFNVPETHAAVDAMEVLIRQGARIIFATSFGHYDAAAEIARRHPDVTVVHQGGVKTDEKLKNLGTYWGSVYEPVYQAGIAAGYASKTGKLGFVAAFPIPAVFANVNAFTLGARSVNPAAETIVTFTEAWCDKAKQADAARKLLNQGVDVLAQHQDCTETVLRAAEAAGVRSVGYHYDASLIAPKSWLVGAVWNWNDLYVDIVKTIIDGKFAASPYAGNFRGSTKDHNNPFILTEYSPNVSDPARRAIEAAGDRFAAGATPFDGPLTDRDNVLRVPAGKSPSPGDVDKEMNYFVQGVRGEIPAR